MPPSKLELEFEFQVRRSKDQQMMRDYSRTSHWLSEFHRYSRQIIFVVIHLTKAMTALNAWNPLSDTWARRLEKISSSSPDVGKRAKSRHEVLPMWGNQNRSDWICWGMDSNRLTSNTAIKTSWQAWHWTVSPLGNLIQARNVLTCGMGTWSWIDLKVFVSLCLFHLYLSTHLSEKRLCKPGRWCAR